MLALFLSNHCILSLVLHVWNKEKNMVGCMANIETMECLLSSNGLISAYIYSIAVKL